jgi:protein-S-isoprenylcysteine O-methyltransferase Ste14
MNIKLIIIFSFSIVYALFEFFVGVKQKQNSKSVETGDKKSIWVLMASISMGYWLSFLIGATKIGRIYQWDTFFAIGSILVIFGLIIRISSILTLKKQFTYTITKIENHQIIEKGLYKYLRHPSYLGQIIIFTSVAAMLSNWISILLMLVAVSIGYIYRIKVEEKFMLQQMGQNYSDYQKRTKKLIPFIY